jgi:hypothetical protein
MKRRRHASNSTDGLYAKQLLKAIGEFLPKRGLPLISDDRRVRWSDRLLIVMAILMSWQEASALKDAFETCWHLLVKMYPTRRRGGYSYEGFIKSLQGRSQTLLSLVCSTLRGHVRRVAARRYWKIGRWLVMGVDGSRIDCPRTAANERAFGCAGRRKTRPQQQLTTMLHVGTGLIWDWRRGGGKEAERTHLRQMLPELPPSCLLLADAGFTGYELLGELLGQGHSFIIRAAGNLRLLKKLGYALREDHDTVYLWPAGKRHQQPLVLRLVCLRDGRKNVYLLTSVLSEAALSDAEMGEMYRRRWGLEVFYRGLKQTMAKRVLKSGSPNNAAVELDWSMVGVWMQGLLTAESLTSRHIDPGRSSVAGARRVLRRIMAGHGGLQAARNLRGLRQAIKDDYVRKGKKASRNRVNKKNESPPKPPTVRTAKTSEKQLAQQIKQKQIAA